MRFAGTAASLFFSRLSPDLGSLLRTGRGDGGVLTPVVPFISLKPTSWPPTGSRESEVMAREGG